VISVVSELLKRAVVSLRDSRKMKYENFDALHQDGKKFQILYKLTAYIEPYYSTVKKSWHFLSWLVE